MRSQLSAELRADVLAGRGKLPRDTNGRVDRRFLEQLERPQETAVERRAAAESLTHLFQGITAAIAPATDGLTSRVSRLQALEQQLAFLLATDAPHLWRQIRAPLRRLLNRAQRELRAADRADLYDTRSPARGRSLSPEP